MNAAGTRAPEAAGAEGTRLAPGRSSPPRRRGRPEESPAAAAAAAAAPGGADEWPAAGAPPRFSLGPPPRPHPAAASGPASGWLRRWRWAALLVLGLLVAGAADGCELVSRHLRGRRASGSAAAAASSPAAAAGDSPALMTGEGPGGGGGVRPAAAGPPSPGGARAPAGSPLYDCHGQCAMWSWALSRQRPGRCFVAVPYSPDAFFLPTSPTPDTPPSTEPLDGTRFSALQSGSPVLLAEQCGGFCSVLQKSQQGLQGTGLTFFLSCYKKSAAALRYLVGLWCCFCKGSWRRVSQVQSPAEHSVPGEAAKEDSLRAIIPSGISDSVLVCGNL